MIKTCQSCSKKFEGRRHAKTCSDRCRKRLYRAKEYLAHDFHKISEPIEHLAIEIESALSPQNLVTYQAQDPNATYILDNQGYVATEAGFVGDGTTSTLPPTPTSTLSPVAPTVPTPQPPVQFQPVPPSPTLATPVVPSTPLPAKTSTEVSAGQPQTPPLTQVSSNLYPPTPLPAKTSTEVSAGQPSPYPQMESLSVPTTIQSQVFVPQTQHLEPGVPAPLAGGVSGLSAGQTPANNPTPLSFSPSIESNPVTPSSNPIASAAQVISPSGFGLSSNDLAQTVGQGGIPSNPGSSQTIFPGSEEADKDGLFKWLQTHPLAIAAGFASIIILITGGLALTKNLSKNSAPTGPLSFQTDKALSQDLVGGTLGISLDTSISRSLQVAGNIQSAATLSANNGDSSLSNTGLKINNTVVCTSRGCLPLGITSGPAGAQGPKGDTGALGIATCPYGDCLSLQATSPGTAENGNINISGTIQANSFVGSTATLTGTVTANSFTGIGSNLTLLDASSVATGTLSVSRLSSTVTLLGQTIETGEITDGTIVNADISGSAAIADTKLATISSAGKVSDTALSSNVALLDRTGPQIFTGDNKFTGTILTQSDSTTAFRIQNSAGSTTLLGANGTTGVVTLNGLAVGAGGVSSNLIPSSNNFYDLGSVGSMWGNIYAQTLHVSSLGGSGVLIDGTTAENFFINSDAPANDTQNMSLVLQTGGVMKNVVLQWNKDNDNLSLNKPFLVKPEVLANGFDGDSTTMFQVQNAAGTNLLVVDSSAQKVAIGPSAVPANSVLTIGTNTSGASGGIYFGTDTNLYRNSAANRLKTDGNLEVGMDYRGTGDVFAGYGLATQIRLSLTGSKIVVGSMSDGATSEAVLGNSIGTGGTPGVSFGVTGLSQDTTLYRASANVLRTTGTIVAATALQAPLFDTSGAVLLGIGTTNASAITIGSTANTGTITLGQSTAGETINIANGTVADTKTNTINIGTSATGTGKDVITIGSTNGASTIAIQGGTGTATGDVRIGDYAVNGKIINIGSVNSTTSSNVNIATAAGNATQTVTIGSAGNTSSGVIIYGGSSGTGTVSLHAANNGGISIGASYDNSVTIGSTTQSALNIITVGRSTVSNEIDIGNANTATGETQTIKIGAGTGVGTGKSVLTIGSTANASSTTIQGGTGDILLNAANIAIGTSAVAANGVLTIGTDTGTAAGGLYFGTDTNLYRVSAGYLKTDTALQVGGVNGFLLLDDTGANTGGIRLGASQDTNLYRSAADTLKTDDNFTVGSGGILTLQSASTAALNVTGGGVISKQLQLTLAGDTGGLLIGGDANLYRSAANTLTTDDTFTSAVAVHSPLFDTATAVALGIGATNATDITIGSSSSVSILTLGRSTASNTINIGAVAGNAATQTINLGTSSTAGSTSNINIGSSIAGFTSITGPTEITGRTSGALTTLKVSNSTSTGNIVEFKDNATIVGSIANGGAVVFQNSSNSNAAFQIQNSDASKTLLSADTTNTKLTVGADIVASAAATATTATTSGTGTDTTTVTLTAGAFTNGDVILIDNAGQDYYTRITAGGGTASLTVSPAVTFETGRTVTKYTIQNIGATSSDYATLTNRFFQGYFTGGIVTGAASTTYSDANIQSLNGLRINTATGVNIKGTDSTTAFQIQNAGGINITQIDTTTDSANLVTNGSLEVDTTGWTARGSSTLSRTTSSPTPYLGLGQLKVVTTAAANDGAKYAYALATTTQYTLTAFARLDSGSAAMATFQMGRADDGSTDTSCLTAQTLVTTGWTRFTCTFTTGTTSGSPYVYFKQTDAAVHTYYLDAVKLEAAAAATPYREGVQYLNGIIGSPTTFKNQSDSTSAFQVQNAAGTSLFTVDTANTRIGIGGPAANAVLTIGTNTTTAAGGIYFGTDTSLYRSATSTLKTGNNFDVPENLLFGRAGAKIIQLEQQDVAYTLSQGRNIVMGTVTINNTPVSAWTIKGNGGAPAGVVYFREAVLRGAVKAADDWNLYRYDAAAYIQNQMSTGESPTAGTNWTKTLSLNGATSTRTFDLKWLDSGTHETHLDVATTWDLSFPTYSYEVSFWFEIDVAYGGNGTTAYTIERNL